ncbi:Threonine synthase [Gammaproteobacteria bacterium]
MQSNLSTDTPSSLSRDTMQAPPSRMRYLSTRGGMAPRSFTEILLEGLAPDGGLTIPEEYPVVSPEELIRWRGLSYRDLAYEVIRRFITDIHPLDLRVLVDRTYTPEIFGSEEITPVRRLDPGVWLLGLSNGPTLAFKDIAMQFLGNLFEYVLERQGTRLNILGATSGDTGSSAEYALRGKRNVRVFMLSPFGKMSAFQTAQMYSLDEPNIHNIAVRGVFDDCQDLVKGVSADADFKVRYQIGTVNSINWARVTAQIVYYFKAYFAVTQNNQQQVSFSVPSGNFGNICAGHIARQMGLPIRKLILATNENNVLAEFFTTGRYRVRPPSQVFQTSSPSMDISKASNFERFVYDAVGRDPERVRALWQTVEKQGFFDASGEDWYRDLGRFGFVAGSSTHEDRLNTIRKTWERHMVVVDTHTADGLKVGLEYREEGVPLICEETAQPAKFEEAIRAALDCSPNRPLGYEHLEELPQYYTVMDPNIEEIKEFIRRHASS